MTNPLKRIWDHLSYAERVRRAVARLGPDGIPERATDIMLPDGPGWVPVTERSHPLLFDAFETISHDSGSGAGRDEYRVPPRWRGMLERFECWLSLMSEEVRDVFIMPVDDQLDRVKGAEPAAEVFHAFLDDFFHCWEATSRDKWARRMKLSSPSSPDESPVLVITSHDD